MAIDLGTGTGCIHYMIDYPYKLASRAGLKLWLADENFYMPHAEQKFNPNTTMQNGCQKLIDTYLAEATILRAAFIDNLATPGQYLIECAPIEFPQVTGTIQFLVLSYSDGDQEFLWAQDLDSIGAKQTVVNQNVILAGPGNSNFPLLCHRRIA